MADKNNFRKYGNLLVRYETPEERGFLAPEELKDLATFHARGTNLLDINIRWRKLNYMLPVFVCAAMGSSGVRRSDSRKFSLYG